MLRKLMFLFLLAMGFSASAFAGSLDRTGKWEAGVFVAAAPSTDQDINTGVTVTGSAAYGLNENWAVGVSAGWVGQSSDDETLGGITIEGTDFNGFPIFADVILRIPTYTEAIRLYGVLGLGVVIWEVDDTATSNGINIETDIDTEFAVKLGAGMDWFINDHWIFNVEGGYVTTRPDTSVTLSIPGTTATSTEEVDLDYWYLGGGLKYQF